MTEITRDKTTRIKVRGDEMNKENNNEVKHAIKVLRKAMKDRSAGEIHYAWMSNIKWAVYDSIKNKGLLECDSDSLLQDGCEDGANLFLHRLFDE